MRVVVGQTSELNDELIAFALQLGSPGIQLNTPNLPVEAGHWTYESLCELRDRCAASGLVLEALENVPMSFMLDIMLGTAAVSEALEHYCTTIRNMGRAGIPVLGYHFMPTHVWRTDMDAYGRGGARVTAFDASKMADGNAVDQLQADARIPVGRERMWANYERFLRAALPVAEESGVRLAMHPDDPPVEATLNVDRLFYNVENLQRAHEMSRGSDAWGLDLCLGTVSEMADPTSVQRAIEYFGPLGRIFYVHFRQVVGRVPRFVECFLGEGNYDPLTVMNLLRTSGFDGFILDDHVPRLVGDTPYGHRARAHAIGYLQAILSATEQLAVVASGGE